ncbi:hypothetical protein NBRC116494_20860 [Aurantivibrio plasticivorans]
MRYLSLFFLFFLSAYACSEAIEVGSTTDIVPVWQHSQFALIAPGVTLSDLMQDPGEFEGLEEDASIPGFGYTEQAGWMRFTLANRDVQDLRLFLDFDYPFIDNIDVYLTQKDQVLQELRTGSRVDNGRTYQSRSPHVSFILPASQSIDVYVRIQSVHLLTFPVRIFSEESYFSHKKHLDAAYYGIFGLYFAFSVFFMVVYAQQRDILYLIFSIQTVARALFDFAYSGELRLTISGYDDFISISYPYFGAFSAATVLWFHAEFLQLRIFSRKMFWLTMGYALLFVVGAQVGLLVDRAVFFMMAPLQIILPIYIFFSTMPALMRRQQAARLYMIGIFVPLALAVLNTLWLTNTIPMVYNFTLWSAIGYSLSFIILAFAMSARIEALADAKNDAEMEAFSAKARDNAKSEFLAHMSHEIRTPLNGVLAMIQMIRDSQLNKEQKQWVDIIHSSGQNLLNIVNDILDFSKIEAGKLSIEQLPTNVSDLIEEVVALYSQGGRDSDVHYTYTVDPSLPQWVRSDPIRIRQILMNFLGNAKKFTKKGTIGVSVKATDNPRVFRISVTDTGIGIAKPQQKKLFNAFEQAESSTFRHFGGTGLGLTICQRLAHLMSGKVGFESEPNKGSCFWVELPFIECDAPRSVDNNEEITLSEHQPLHVLVAEDNAVNQTIITTILKKLGHTSLITSDGVEVVDTFCENPSQFDVILMDCDMPKQDGYQATRVIREFEQEHQLDAVPIVALTAHAVKEFQAKSIACGMNEHLTKPIVINALSTMLANYQQKNAQRLAENIRQYV